MPEPLDRVEEKSQPSPIKRPWKIAVLANIKDDNHPKPEGVPPDAFADFDHIETIDSLRAALETDGHQTTFIQADTDLPYALRDERPDICFNIAEGLGGDAPGAGVEGALDQRGIGEDDFVARAAQQITRHLDGGGRVGDAQPDLGGGGRVDVRVRVGHLVVQGLRLRLGLQTDRQ